MKEKPDLENQNKNNNEENIEGGAMELTRREVLSIGAGAAALTAMPSYGLADGVNDPPLFEAHEPTSWEGIEPTEDHLKVGFLVKVEKLLVPELPIPDPVEILKRDTGLIISKRFHRFWLFKDGKLLDKGVVGTARYDKGYDTPEGVFEIYRKEGEDYSSREFPSYDPNVPNMAFATFFNKRGIAFHSSLNFREFALGNNPEDKTLYLKLDNSHGCVNATKGAAELANTTLTFGDRVAVLP